MSGKREVAVRLDLLSNPTLHTLLHAFLNEVKFQHALLGTVATPTEDTFRHVWYWMEFKHGPGAVSQDLWPACLEK